MIPIQEALTDSERAAAKALDIQLQRFVSPIRRDEIRRELGAATPVEYRSTPDPGYTVDPGEGLDVPGLFD
jgi:hypothetical protein